MEEIYSFKFGMNLEKIELLVESMSDSNVTIVNREGYLIISSKTVKVDEHRHLDQLNLFIDNESGLFAAEEELFIQWDHQQPDNENMEAHRTSLEEILKRLRDRYGPEDLLEETEIGLRYRKTNFVSSSWKLMNNRWIHVIYEPQDWELFPEMVKIVIIYRDAGLDPR